MSALQKNKKSIVLVLSLLLLVVVSSAAYLRFFQPSTEVEQFPISLPTGTTSLNTIDVRLSANTTTVTPGGKLTVSLKNTQAINSLAALAFGVKVDEDAASSFKIDNYVWHSSINSMDFTNETSVDKGTYREVQLIAGTKESSAVNIPAGSTLVSFDVTYGTVKNGYVIDFTSGNSYPSIVVVSAGELQEALKSYTGATSVNVTVAKANQTALSLTGGTGTHIYGASRDYGVTGGSGTGAVSFSVTGNATVNSTFGVVTPTSGTGTYTITATKAGDSSYNPASVSATVTLAKATQTITLSGASTAQTYGTTRQFSVSGGTGALTYSITGGATVNATGLVTANSGTGSYTLSATKAGDNNYNSATDSITVSLAKANQSTVTVSAPTSVQHPAEITLSASGGNAGTYSYTKVSGPATLSGNKLTTTGSGTVVVNATRSGDNNYNSATSSNLSIPVAAANVAPTVSLTGPANGSTFTRGQTVTLTATASDSDGSVASVKFYAGSTLLNTDTSSPYSYVWTPSTAGSYSLTAVATDNQGATKTSNAVSITVNNPTASAPTFSPAGGNYTTVQSVTLSSATSGSAIYYCTTSNCTPSTSSTRYTGAISVNSTTTIRAIATASGYNNSSVSSATYTINLNQAPTLSAINTAKSTYLVGEDVVVNASASDPDNNLSSVTFTATGLSSVTDSSSPYSATFKFTSGGSKTLSATARDSANLTSSAKTVTITVLDGNFNGDSTTDLKDALVLTGVFFGTETANLSTMDLNQDGSVNILDLIKFLTLL